jgi:hypothetical protein
MKLKVSKETLIKRIIMGFIDPEKTVKIRVYSPADPQHPDWVEITQREKEANHA